MSSGARLKDEEVIKVALDVLSDDMLIDLVAFCRTHAEYRQSDLHQMAQDVLRARCLLIFKPHSVRPQG
jgi:hypothetical protein